MNRINNFIYYNATELFEIINGETDVDYIVFCIDALIYHYTKKHLSDTELKIALEWTDFILANQ